MTTKGKTSVVIGLGKTGWSCARFLYGRGESFVMMDTRDDPPQKREFHDAFPGVQTLCGELDADVLREASRIVVSPGVPISHPALRAASLAGVPIVGDIELFALINKKPVIAITGSNAKSTVTTLVGEMARACGLRVAVAGNIGQPVLDILDDSSDVYVLELSSFQLETTWSLKPDVAAILNISEDHMDRYDALTDYIAAKQRIYKGSRACVYNRQDVLTEPAAPAPDVWTFGLDVDAAVQSVGIVRFGEEEKIATGGVQALMAVHDVKIPGRHNLANVAAAFAIAAAAGWLLPACAQAVRRFSGLAHRCQWVAEKQGVQYYNDSKGTNVGATVAAIRGLAGLKPNVVLLAGGDGKGADFHPLAPVVEKHVRHLVLIGRDARLIAQACSGVPNTFAQDMGEAVRCAASHAEQHDVVLLSPACASFDMFTGYDDRGRQFCQAVEALP